jgi:hypothetical protein
VRTKVRGSASKSRYASLARERNSRGSLAEFGPALVLFFAFLLVPTLLLIRFGLATTAMYFVIDSAADTAAKAPSYGLALNGANGTVREFLASPIACFTGLKAEQFKPLSLYVNEQVTATGITNVFGPNQPLLKPVCSAINTYEYEVRGSYSFQPLLPCAAWFGKIPLLTAPMTLTAHEIRAVDYPDGLTVQ